MGARRRLFAPRRQRRYGCLVLLLALLAVLALVFSLNALSNQYVNLQTQQVTVLELPKALEKFTFLHLSDLHAATFGKDQANLKTALKDQDYRAVVLTGDMVGKSGSVEPLLQLLGVLKPDVPVFFVAGDSDPSPLSARAPENGPVYAPWVLAAQQKGAIYVETPYLFQTDGQNIWFCPASLFTVDLENARFALTEQIKALQSGQNPSDSQTAARLRLAEHRLKIINRSEELLSEIKQTDIIIALSHIPPDNEELAHLSQESREKSLPSPSLFLAGHFNNGQMRLPGLGAIYIPPHADGRGGFFPEDEGFAGLSIKKGYAAYISPGLGASDYYPLSLRLFNRPSGTLIVLTAHMTR
jgi:predicted MPP superfamily phosphohydrolase